MAQDVPIPAESLRQLTTAAENEIENLRENDLNASARKLERTIPKFLALAEGKDGEFVSVDATDLATVTADASFHTDTSVARQYLEQYNVW
jgi:hypothetical protein